MKQLVLMEEEIDKICFYFPSMIFSSQDKEHLVNLEAQTIKNLMIKEEIWRLKSRAIWVYQGDNNIKFFQNFAKKRRISNAIWNLKDEQGFEIH